MPLSLLILAICYLPPVDAPIVDPYRAPVCEYCPGHRGIEYELAPGTPVRASASGVVEFSGAVAGTRYVVVLDDDGVRATYGKLQSASVHGGDLVTVGRPIGRSTGRLYFGLRLADDSPLDPNGRLAIVSRRARLIPTDGSPARPAATRAPRCADVAESASSAR